MSPPAKPAPFDATALLDARGAGQCRYVLIATDGDDLRKVLGLCGLQPQPASLVEHDRAGALSLLTRLLWKDQAYGTECMPQAQAQAFAQGLIEAHAGPDVRYYANSRGQEPQHVSPLTEATFDAGLLIRIRPGRFACIWIEDED